MAILDNAKGKNSVLELIKSLAWAIAVVLVIRSFIVEPFKIPSGSMIPNLKIGDHIFVSKFTYGLEFGWRARRVKIATWGQPARGDVIVFIFPNDPSVHYIKRVVGVPGDRVEVKDTVVWVNGEPSRLEPAADRSVLEAHGDRDTDLSTAEVFQETLPGTDSPHLVLMDPFNRAPFSRNTFFAEVQVPDDHFFVMGDNRDHSSDSRVWGFVPFKLVKGKAQMIWLSLNSSDPVMDLGLFSLPSVRWSRWFNRVR